MNFRLLVFSVLFFFLIQGGVKKNTHTFRSDIPSPVLSNSTLQHVDTVLTVNAASHRSFPAGTCKSTNVAPLKNSWQGFSDRLGLTCRRGQGGAAEDREGALQVLVYAVLFWSGNHSFVFFITLRTATPAFAPPPALNPPETWGWLLLIWRVGH